MARMSGDKSSKPKRSLSELGEKWVDLPWETLRRGALSRIYWRI